MQVKDMWSLSLSGQGSSVSFYHPAFMKFPVHRVKTVHPGPQIFHLSVGNKQNLFFISCLSFIHILKVKLDALTSLTFILKQT